MKPAEFQNYLTEYAANGIGPLLYGLIFGVVRATVLRYPQTVYSPNGVWDEDAVSGVCHDFMREKLLQAGWLDHHLLTQETSEGLKRVLKRDFRHFLISRKRRSEYLNLYERVKTILIDDPRFEALALGKTTHWTIWGLANWNDKGISQDRDELLKVMFSINLRPLVRYRADSKKYSHLLSNADLTRFLENTFRELDKHIQLDLLMDGLRYRLNLLETEQVSLDEPIGIEGEGKLNTYGDLIPDSTDVHLEVNAKEIAADVFDRLSDRQRHILTVFSSLAHPTFEEIGRQIHASKSTASNEMMAIGRMIASLDMIQEEAERVYSFLSERCEQWLIEADEQ